MSQKSDNIDERRLWKDELVPLEPEHSDYHVSPGYRPRINPITMSDPWVWLHSGWNDLRGSPGTGLLYGFLIALLYGAIIAFSLATELYHVGLQLTAGFVLVAPILALAFYEISRRRERDEPTSFRHTWTAWSRNPKGLLGMGVLMVLLFLTWFMISMWMAALLAESSAELALLVGAESFPAFYQALVTDLSTPVILGYLLIGLVAVLVAFALSAVSIPMLMDHPETDAITAMVTSWHAVIANWKPMLLWAVMIAAITAIGLAFFYIGLAVTMPLLGFATWHAYRNTLGEWKTVETPDVAYY